MENKNIYAVIDIGGTNTRVALCENGNISNKISFKTNTSNPVETLTKVAEYINEQENISGIGISAPGPADYDEGKFFELPNLSGWTNFEFIKFLKEKTRIENIKSQNDANLMALAHHFEFGGTERDVTQFFTVSTGLGAGLVINNKVFTGFNGLAQEIAQAPLAWKQESGKGLTDGAIELFSSGSGIECRGNKTTQEVLNDREGHKEIVQDAIEALANLLATSIAFMNPSKIIFDGSVARYNQWYIDEAIKIAESRTNHNQFKAVEFHMAKLGDDAALIGAFHLVSDK